MRAYWQARGLVMEGAPHPSHAPTHLRDEARGLAEERVGARRDLMRAGKARVSQPSRLPPCTQRCTGPPAPALPLTHNDALGLAALDG